MNVVIEQPASHPIVTKDGVTVAKSVRIKDKFKNLGVDIVKEAAARTADIAGDGTTTSTVIARSLFAEGSKMIAAGYKARDITTGIKKCSSDIIEYIVTNSKDVSNENEIMQVATISANGEKKIGELITEATSRLGSDGVITVEMAKGFISDLIVVEGMQINRGYLSPYFVNNTEKMSVEFENPYIFLCSQKINSIHKISHLLECSLKENKPIVIVAEDVDGEALQGLVLNSTRGSLQVCAIKPPGFGNARVGMMEDLSLMLGTSVFNGDEETLKSLQMSDLGTCSKVLITRGATVFVDCTAAEDKIEERQAQLRDALLNPRITEDEENVLRIRLARLAGGVGIIRVGGATEGEVIERKDRVDDALSATQAAIDEGIVPGGGVCLVNAATSIDIESYPERLQPGARAMRNACYSPIAQILKNAGESPDLVISKIQEEKSFGFGFNVITANLCNMFDEGIIDPSKVTRCAIENGVSAACTLLSVGCAMIEEKCE